MSKSHFGQFPHDADSPENTKVTNENSFESPSQKVSNGEHIKMIPNFLYSDVRTIDAVFLVHINVKGRESRIHPDQYFPNSFVILKEHKEQEHKIKDAAAKYESPDNRMRSGKWPIGKREDRDDEKKKYDADHSCP